MRYLAFFLHLLSLGLWIPGIFIYPVVSFSFSFGGGGGLFSSLLNLSEKVELSVWQSLKELVELKQWTVVALIAVFSLLVPLIKALVLFYAQWNITNTKGQKGAIWVSRISKWAMADVFAMGILIAGLSSFEGGAKIQASSETGLHYFAAYVVLSMLAAQLTVKASTRYRKSH